MVPQRFRARARALTLILTLLAPLVAGLLAQPQPAAAEERAAIALWNALVPLKSVNTFMNTGAHPDDERSSILAYVSRGLGARVVSVIANRGEGGQNAIGKEVDAALGVIRSRELEEASKVTGVELVILSSELRDSIYDFGFSKTPEETLAQWGHDRTLERLVRVIRTYRPDVILPSFLNSHGQHGHHRAMTVLTEEAIRAAADPNAFPEHLKEGLRPWQVKKMYLPADAGEGGVYADTQSLPVTLSLPVGEYDPMLGLSYAQLGEESRSYHKSQGQGTFVPEGPLAANLHLHLATVPVPDKEQSLFDGLPKTVRDLAYMAYHDLILHFSLLEAQAAIDEALAAYPNRVKVADAVTQALAAVRKARARLAAGVPGMDEERRSDIDFRLSVKEQQLQEAARQAALLVTRLEAASYELSRGGSTTFTLTAFRGGPVPVKGLTLDLVAPAGWKVERVDGPTAATDLAYNQAVKATFKVTVPEDAPYFHPYRPLGLYGVVRYETAAGPVTVQVRPQALVAVLPDVSLAPAPDGLVYNLEEPGKTLEFKVAATNLKAGAAQTTLRVEAPEGWTVTPQQVPLSFTKKGEVQTVTFRVTPPANTAANRYVLGLRAEGAAQSAETVRTIQYPHIGRTYMVLPAQVEVQAFPVKVQAGLKVGYVDGGLDRVPEALRQLGVNVRLLTPEDLASGDLSQYDTIVIGVRAYRTRPDLVANNGRLLEYVRAGGNLVVQYHQPGDNWNPRTLPPYYLKIGSPSFNWRVTDENSPVEYLQPDHPLLNRPNRITADDWKGWVKDRGLYFAAEWAPEYTPLLAMNDPGEPPHKGILLTAQYGKGRYTFTSLILYYQLEQRVPGAYRIFANLISP